MHTIKEDDVQDDVVKWVRGFGRRRK